MSCECSPVSAALGPASAARKARLAEFQDLLAQNAEVDLKRLRHLCFQGCPDGNGIRATCWKLLLGYLPPKVSTWATVLKEQRHSYLQLRSEVLCSPHLGEQNDSGEVMDHPLNPDPSSTWHRYFEDNDLLLQIDHDARRLCPDMSFFQLPTPFPQAKFNTGTIMDIDALKKRVDRSTLPSQQIATSRGGIINMSSQKHSSEENAYMALKEGEEAHWEVVERLLFLYAKTNTGIGYVQGMNEIIGPLYYVFAQHPDSNWKAHAEADTFFCFTALMTEIGDKFTKKLDYSRAGIGGALHSLMGLLEKRDPELHSHLVEKGMDPTFFGFRWITLMLSQEFLLPEVIRIWDSLLADEKRFSFLITFCGAMMICIREQLLKADFSGCMKLLQHFPLSDTQKLFLKAQELTN